VRRSRLAAPVWATAILALGFVVGVPAAAWAQRANTSALDLVYEASDAIDAAKEEIRAGRQREADRLLNRAERFLDEAARLAPDLRRVEFERARLVQLDGDPSRAEGLMIAAMYGPLEPRDHVRAVGALDDIRADLGKPTVGVQWRRATIARNIGLAAVAAGTITALAGFAACFDALAQDTYNRVDQPDLTAREAGLGVALVGAGIAGAGAGVAISGEFGRRSLNFVLPGPWRLPGGRLERGSKASKRPDSVRATRELQ
jgi:hypothetical protein